MTKYNNYTIGKTPQKAGEETVYHKNQLYFSTYNEAKCALLTKINHLLNESTLDSTVKEILIQWQQQVQIAIASHNQNMAALCQPYLALNENSKKTIAHIIDDTFIEKLKKGPNEKLLINSLNQDLLIREVESALPLELLNNPTQKMFETIKLVSDRIKSTLMLHRQNDFQFRKIAQIMQVTPSNVSYLEDVKNFCIDLIQNETEGVMHTGGFSLKEINEALKSQGLASLAPSNLTADELTLEQVKVILSLTEKTLIENKNFERIMFIHYIFAFRLMNTVALAMPKKKEFDILLTSPIAQEISKRYSSSEQVKDALRQPTAEGHQARDFILKCFLFSDYYTHDREQGNAGRMDANKRTESYGIFTLENIHFLNQFKLLKRPNVPVAWSANAVSQQADLSSPIVKANLNQEVAYVAGPSHTFANLIILHLLLNPDDDLTKTQIYLQSCLAYIVGIGLNSVHEVLGPAQFNLNLLPGYPVGIPNFQSDMPTPNYQVFYEIAQKNDPEFQDRLNAAWNKVCEFYFTLSQNDESLDKQHSDKKSGLYLTTENPVLERVKKPSP